MALVISEAPHALDLTGGRVLGRGETANVDLSNRHEATYYDEGWLTIIDGSSPPPPPTPPESIQVAGSPFETGQVIYYDGLEWVVLNPGDAGEVLMTHGVNAIPEWVPIDVSMFAFDPATQTELDVHAADTTFVHGIDNTADILYKTLADAKGDIFVATAPDTLVRLPVGANNTFLKANSAQPLGVEWATVPAPDLTPYAPKASPVFTGTIGVPIYTLATRPAATVGAASLVYVSDAPAGQQLQFSDGTNWSSSTMDLSALSATIPNKIAWEYPAGTDVVEFWGERIASGAWLSVYTNDFNTSIADWTLEYGSWGIASGRMDPSFGGSVSGNAYSFVGGPATTGPIRVGTTMVAVSPANHTHGIVFRKAAFDGLFIYLDQTTINVSRMGNVGNNTPSSTLLQSWARSVSGTGGGYLRVSRVVNDITVEYWNGATSPAGAPTDTHTYTLVGADATAYGGASLAPGLFEGGNNFEYDDFTVEYQASEQRDLYAAVTPAGGTRTVKRILGANGATLRSDFAQMVSVGTSRALQLPIFTLASRPSAAGASGAAIYVSDATQGQKLQTSDGTTWSTVAVVLDALSASTPDKLAWEYPSGTDVVELYGSRTLAGFAIAALDDLNTDTSAAWNVRSGDGTQQNVWTGTTWKLPGTGSYGEVWYSRSTWGLADDQARMKVKGKNSAGFGTWGRIMAGFATAAMTKGITATLWANGTVNIQTNGVGSNTDKVQWTTVVSMPPAGTYYWLELTRSGNNYIATVYAADGTTVLWTSGVQPIPVNNVGVVGAGQSLYPAFGIGRNVLGGEDGEVDQVEFYTQQPEAHDLFVAVTAASAGPRTVKRLFGSSGGATFRSDFAQMVSIGLVQALQLPIFTLASRPAASGAGGAAVFVSDATAGTRLQYSDGTSWIATAPIDSPTFTGTPAAPTQAAADSSTKLATTAYADRLAQQVFAINTQVGTTYTTVLADAGKVIEMNNGAAMTLTIPPNSAVAYPIGTRMRGVRLGAGALTIAQGAGVVLRNKIEAAGTTNRTIPAQYGEWQLYKRATDEWVLTGDIA